jgi:hypothetical protein
MIYIEKNIESTVALTLGDSSLLINHYFLFEIINNLTLDSFFISYPDLSGYPERYSLFYFDLDIAKGEYTYNVYESENPSPTELSDTTEILIETGIMIVNDDTVLTTDIYL